MGLVRKGRHVTNNVGTVLCIPKIIQLLSISLFALIHWLALGELEIPMLFVHPLNHDTKEPSFLGNVSCTNVPILDPRFLENGLI